MNARVFEVVLLNVITCIFVSVLTTSLYLNHMRLEVVPTSVHFDLVHVDKIEYLEEIPEDFDPESQFEAGELFEELSFEDQLRFEHCKIADENGRIAVDEVCYCGFGAFWCNPENDYDVSCCINDF